MNAGQRPTLTVPPSQCKAAAPPPPVLLPHLPPTDAHRERSGGSAGSNPDAGGGGTLRRGGVRQRRRAPRRGLNSGSRSLDPRLKKAPPRSIPTLGRLKMAQATCWI